MCVIGGKAAVVCVVGEKGYPLGMCSWEKGSTHVTGPGLFCVVGGMGAYVVRPSLFSRIKTKTYGL